MNYNKLLTQGSSCGNITVRQWSVWIRKLCYIPHYWRWRHQGYSAVCQFLPYHMASWVELALGNFLLITRLHYLRHSQQKACLSCRNIPGFVCLFTFFSFGHLFDHLNCNKMPFCSSQAIIVLYGMKRVKLYVMLVTLGHYFFLLGENGFCAHSKTIALRKSLLPKRLIKSFD